jgi:8-oxo-dGTP pyrophosphatase MutT (NUDIX family)
MLEELAERLRRRLANPLPGESAHAQVSHQERKDFFSNNRVPDDAVSSSVLIMLYMDGDEIRFPLIRRAVDGHVHSGQIGLPGGRRDESDEDEADTALRELEEEIGVDRNSVELLGRLSELYIPPSNFKVYPYVGIHRGSPAFVTDPREVDHVIEAGLSEFFYPENLRQHRIVLRSGREIDTPAFIYKGHTVWGATAMMLNELRWLIEAEDHAG